MFEVRPEVKNRSDALRMLHLTRTLLVPQDLRAVLGFSSPERVGAALEALEGFAEVVAEGPSLDPEGVTRQVLRRCWRTGTQAEPHPLTPVVLRLRSLLTSPEPHEQVIREVLQGCTWREWLLLASLREEESAAELMAQLGWVATGVWLHLYGWVRWEARAGER